MNRSGPAAGAVAVEWAGRTLVVLQFGLLAILGWRAWLHLLAPGLAAASCLAGSAALAVWALVANRPGNFNIRPTPRSGGSLVTHGPYRWIRHPMYTAVLLAAAAAGMASGQVLDALLWTALLAVLWAKAVIEERALLVRYPAYQDYRQRTRRFLPWIV